MPEVWCPGVPGVEVTIRIKMPQAWCPAVPGVEVTIRI